MGLLYCTVQRLHIVEFILNVETAAKSSCCWSGQALGFLPANAQADQGRVRAAREHSTDDRHMRFTSPD